MVARISLTLSRHFSHRSSPLAGLLGYIPYPHIVAEYMFVLVVLLLLGHMWGSICLVRLTWIVLCFNQTGDIFTLDGTPLKLVDKLTYLGSSVSSTEKDIDTRLTKAWTAINRLSIIWKSDLTDKMKRSFFQAAVASILLYGCTTWTVKVK